MHNEHYFTVDTRVNMLKMIRWCALYKTNVFS